MSRLSWRLALTAVVLSAMFFAQSGVAEAAGPAVSPRDVLAEPAISPVGSEIAFVSGPDLWTVPAAGGEARLLTSNLGHISRPLYSPDGKRLAFISTLTGNGDIYVLTLDTGHVERLTFDDAREQLDAWSADGKWLYFSSSAHDISSMGDVYRVSVDGGTPMPVIADGFSNECDSAPSPDGTSVAFCAGGYSAHWWRRGHSHLDTSEIWLMNNAAGSTPQFTRLTDFGARHSWPMWSPDGKSLYYVCDRNKAANLWSITDGKPPRQITSFTDGRVLWPTLSHDGRTIVFERDCCIWKLSVKGGGAKGSPEQLSIHLRGAVHTRTVRHAAFDKDISELTVSPDGKKLGLIIHGQVFAAPADGGAAVRVTWTHSIESHIAWAHDSHRIVYVSDRDGPRHLYLYDFETQKETRLTNAPNEDGYGIFSHNDQHLAFRRAGSEIRIYDFVGSRERLLARNQAFEQAPLDGAQAEIAWSPGDGWLAWVSAGQQGFSNIYACPSAGGVDPRQVSFFANYENTSLYWSPRGSYLVFGSGQRTEPYQIARIDVVERTPQFNEDQFRELFRDDTRSRIPSRMPQPSAITKPRTRPSTGPASEDKTVSATRARQLIDFNGIEQRVTLLSAGVDVVDLSLSPDGKWIGMLGKTSGRRNIFMYPLDGGPAITRQLTSSTSFKHDVQFRTAADGKSPVALYYLANGEVHSTWLDGTERAISIKAEMDIDFDQEKITVFEDAWKALRDHFHDRNFNGVDWNAVHAHYEPLAAGAKDSTELRRILELMVGELNASHLGVSTPEDDIVTATGRLGMDFDRSAYEKDGVMRITHVVALSPAAVAGIEPGKYLHTLDDSPVGRHVNLDNLLQFKIGHETVLGISKTAGGSDEQKVRLLPMAPREEKTLRYREWVQSRREFVKKISGGRLGYIHLADMSESGLARLYTDLNSEMYKTEAVVVDLRNNNGGFVNGYASDVFARRNYIRLTERGFPTTSGRVALGQRFLGLPTILLTNRHTLSDGEDFTEGYQAQRLGKTIGEPTAGWIIFTTGIRLLDGSMFRLPHSTVTDHGGKVMEMHPRHVDVLVHQPVGEGYAGDDIQLRTAVEELTDQIDAPLYASFIDEAINHALTAKHEQTVGQ